LHNRQVAADRQKRRAEKFEELVAALYEHKHWLDTVEKIRVLARDEPITASPLAKVEAISAVYFPEFGDQIRALGGVAGEYELWMMEAGEKMVRNDPAYTEGLIEARAPYLQAFLALLSELRAFARREFQ
jgi:hypothetical protein